MDGRRRRGRRASPAPSPTTSCPRRARRRPRAAWRRWSSASARARASVRRSCSRSGLYAPLRARGALVGLVAIEQHEPGFYGRRELRLLDGFVEPAALAIDNARWFARLRTIGADEERVRIARDMHDRVGQSLAFVAFKLDRLTALADGA